MLSQSLVVPHSGRQKSLVPPVLIMSDGPVDLDAFREQNVLYALCL